MVDFIAAIGNRTFLELSFQEYVVSAHFERYPGPGILLGYLYPGIGDRLFTITGQFGIEGDPGSLYLSKSGTEAPANFSEANALAEASVMGKACPMRFYIKRQVIMPFFPDTQFGLSSVQMPT